MPKYAQTGAGRQRINGWERNVAERLVGAFCIEFDIRGLLHQEEGSCG